MKKKKEKKKTTYKSCPRNSPSSVHRMRNVQNSIYSSEITMCVCVCVAKQRDNIFFSLLSSLFRWIYFLWYYARLVGRIFKDGQHSAWNYTHSLTLHIFFLLSSSLFSSFCSLCAFFIVITHIDTEKKKRLNEEIYTKYSCNLRENRWKFNMQIHFQSMKKLQNCGKLRNAKKKWK